MTLSWYVALVSYGKQQYASSNLKIQGFDSFYPLIRKADKKNFVSTRPTSKNKFEPLFPGYIFVGFPNQGVRWQSINGTYGLRGLVGARVSAPSPVPDAIMASLFENCPEGVWNPAVQTWCRGDGVEVRQGAFAGIPARFDEMLSQNRVKVLLSWLGGEVPAVMPRDYIVAAL